MLKVSKQATGKQIKRYMDEKDLTCKEVAWEIGIKPGTLRAWIRGESIPTIETLGRLTQLLECGFDDLICYGK